MEGDERSLDLGTGTTRANFQALGRCPDDKDKLNSLVRLDAIDVAVSFNILAEMLSEPVALLISSFVIISMVSSSVQRRSSGKFTGSNQDTCVGRGGRVLLKHS